MRTTGELIRDLRLANFGLVHGGWHENATLAQDVADMLAEAAERLEQKQAALDRMAEDNRGEGP